MEKVKSVLLIICLTLFFQNIYARTITVGKSGADYTSIQEAVNNARNGDIIEIIDNEVYNERVVIEKDTNITIRSRSYREEVEEGGKRWPSNMPTIRFQDTEHVHPQTDDETQSIETIDFDQNGAVLVTESADITIEGIRIDGGGIVRDWTDFLNSWGGTQLFGNNAIAIRLSRAVKVRYCDIKNALRGLHLKDRNVKGVFAESDVGDVDINEYAPGALPLAMGNHVIEYNRIHDCHWGILLDAMKDAASTIRFNLIYRNGPYSDYDNYQQEAQNAGADAGQWMGGAFKVHGIDYVPMEIYNNTFWKNCDIFNSHWKSGAPNFRIYNNLFALRADGIPVGSWDMLFNWQKSSEGVRGYGTIIKYNGFQRQSDGVPKVPNYKFENGGDNPTITGDLAISFVGRDISGNHNIYIDGGSGDLFRTTDEGSDEFLVPKDYTSEVQDGVKDRGDPNCGVYSADGSTADLGAFDVDGNWQNTGVVELLDRERYAVVDFQRTESELGLAVVDLRPFIRYTGDERITDIDFVFEKYSEIAKGTQTPPEYKDLERISTTLDDEDEKKEILNQLNSGNEVEIRYVGKAPDFKPEGSNSQYARFYVQLEVTTESGKKYRTKIGYFDYRVTPIQFYVNLYDYDVDNHVKTGEAWDAGKNIYVNTPFWAEIEAYDVMNNAPKDMTIYNSEAGGSGILAFAETVRDALEEWNDKDGDGEIDEDEWERVTFLSGKWTSDGKYENVFRITKPTVGEQEYFRVFLQGSDATKSMMSGSSKWFRVLTVADSIAFYGDNITPEGVYQPENGTTREKIRIAVLDEDGNRMVGQWVKVRIVNDGDDDIGSLFDYGSKENVDELWVKTDLKGYAIIYVNITDKAGVTGKIIAETSTENGGKFEEGDNSKIITGVLPIIPAFVDTVPTRLLPNVINRDVIKKLITVYGENINPENYDKTTLDKIIASYNGSGGWNNSGLLLIDIPIKTGSKGTGNEQVAIDIIVVNAQGNIVKIFKPRSADNSVYIIDREMAATQNKLQLVPSPVPAKFVGDGVIEKPKSSDIRVVVPWNHVNAKGRLAEKGAFFIKIEISKDNNLIKKYTNIYIVK